MTLDELLKDEVFCKAINSFDKLFIHSANKIRFCHYKQRIFSNASSKLFSISGHRKNNITIYDYTSLTQQEIHNIIDAKIKYDYKGIKYDTFSLCYNNVISENNEHIKKYDLSQLTPELLHEIIYKNEVFISNLNSLYSSNKILAELDAL